MYSFYRNTVITQTNEKSTERHLQLGVIVISQGQLYWMFYQT
jgi:hypothetical protein